MVSKTIIRILKKHEHLRNNQHFLKYDIIVHLQKVYKIWTTWFQIWTIINWVQNY